ncbi:MAG TPA: hypothetical protein EYQ54_10165 [Myxococcales bacterium]|nr:hypothetical protein [Myxococcales bacterium]
MMNARVVLLRLRGDSVRIRHSWAIAIVSSLLFLAQGCGEPLVIVEADYSVAREWNDVLLDAIRVDTPRPTVHSRNLFHLSVVMWDCWVAYDTETSAVPYWYFESHETDDVAGARHACISRAAFRLLKYRFANSIGAGSSIPSIDAKMLEMGYELIFVPTGADDESPQAVGYRIASSAISHGLSDGANEANDYEDPDYSPVNLGLIFKISGTGFGIVNPNRWSPLAFDFACLQNGIPLPGAQTQIFVGSNWNAVTPFALTREDDSVPYFDPGAPPMAVDFDPDLGFNGTITGPGDPEFKEQILSVVRYSSLLNPDDAPVINYSPAVRGNNSLMGLANYVFDGTGYGVNPVTGEDYEPNWMNQADYGRVLAEFWADGPDSETPPGHWNTLANYVSDHPDVVKRIRGTGPVVDDLEWDVKIYLAVNGALHDSAIAAWGAKAIYDYTRPIQGIRWLIEQGQSSTPGLVINPAPTENLPEPIPVDTYSEHGMLLEAGLSELITPASSAAGQRHHHLRDYQGEIALNVWPGEPGRADPPTCLDVDPEPDAEHPSYSGREWIRGVDWTTYQKRTFVTPPFAAYISGHSSFSRAAAEVLSRFTASPYFPGGFGEFVAPKDEFLLFEVGPTETVHLQWATYFDAADEAGISRLWGGIHIAADDFEGRLVGAQIGVAAFELAEKYWDGTL